MASERLRDRIKLVLASEDDLVRDLAHLRREEGPSAGAWESLTLRDNPPGSPNPTRRNEPRVQRSRTRRRSRAPTRPSARRGTGAESRSSPPRRRDLGGVEGEAPKPAFPVPIGVLTPMAACAQMVPMKPSGGAGALLLIALTCPACFAPLEVKARAKFSNDVMCPEGRVTVGSRLLLRTEPQPQPPPGIAGDPARLQMWQQKDEQRRSAEEKNKRTYFRADGCGESRVYSCYHCRYTETGQFASCRWAGVCDGEVGCTEVPGRPGYIDCSGR